MDEEIPQSLAVLAASISGTKVRLQKLQVELEALARAREQAETAYRATLKDDTEFDFGVCYDAVQTPWSINLLSITFGALRRG
jgi:hypothetical protein